MMAEKGEVDVTVFTEEDVLRNLRRNRWLAVTMPDGYKLFAMNWVVSLIASIGLWAFIIWSSADPNGMHSFWRGKGKPWVSQNFTWLYVVTQDAWGLLILWLCFSKHGSLKFGADNEKPRFSDLAWFSMLFTCGLGIGFFFYGANEPLYYYRQPQSWGAGNLGTDLIKPGPIQTDDQRGNQAIFITMFHWGLHGWFPYLIPTITLGLVSHRWGLPMTIRSTFYPLIGNHVFSLLGDLIDAISIVCTTFGVCTSLVLGGSQIQYFCRRIYRGRLRYNRPNLNWPPEFCPFPSGGNKTAWDLGDTSAAPSCDEKLFQQLMIWSITVIAMISVITGLDKGLKWISYLAIVLAIICFLMPFVADDCWYLLNVMVQQIGYYLQHAIETGFDCEAFQQMGYEVAPPSSNWLWGYGDNILMASLRESVSNKTYMGQQVQYGTMTFDAGHVATSLTFASNDCGNTVNPCNTGTIIPAIAAMSGAYLTQFSVGAADSLKAYTLAKTYSSATAIPCGSYSHNATHVDSTTVMLNPSWNIGDVLPASLSSYSWPKCPTTIYDKVASWGTCSKFTGSCQGMKGLHDSTNRGFMDGWTIFYWGWWISWAPFFGIFVAQISRGRSIRQVVLGALMMPCLASLVWFASFGGLVIKMQRIAELALGVKPDWQHGQVDCSGHYSGGVPISPEALALASTGYSMIACKPWDEQIMDLMEPYMFAEFWWVVALLALFLWYITSSDSGSYADDLQASSGLSHPPALQKVYWCITEGALASIILSLDSVSKARQAIQAVALVSGLPYTILLCFMTTAVIRVVYYESGDERFLSSNKFNTQLFDFAEGYHPDGGSPYSPIQHFSATLLGLFAPFIGIRDAAINMWGSLMGNLTALACGTLYFLWFLFHCLQGADNLRGIFAIAWTWFYIFAIVVAGMRTSMRAKYNIWGSFFEDVIIAIFMWPFAIGQMQLQARNDGEGMPKYCALFDQLKEKLALRAAGGGVVKTQAIESSQA